jgi:NAD(P)-dependent dehydrogenase (short-subunit alcohol dehydrogenase family)
MGRKSQIFTEVCSFQGSLKSGAKRKHMNDKTCLITGATSGIGKASALALAKMGYGLILLGRNEAKLEKTCREVRLKSSNYRIGSYICDLSVMKDVRVAADRIKGENDRIDVLINNAGARFLQHEVTKEGIELTLATNHLGHFVLTLSLIKLLEKSGRARIINVSSGTHYAGTGDIENILSARDYDGRKQYANSKLANVLFTYALADKLNGRGITANAVNPGGVATNFARNNGLKHWLRHRLYYLSKRQLLTPKQGAETLLFLASSEDVAGITGKYFADKQEKKSSVFSHDKETQEKLWAKSVALSGIDI